jgi:replicative DNA helicase
MYQQTIQDVNGAIDATQNIDAEKALLGALLMDNAVLEKIPFEFTSDQFIEPLHADIFDNIKATCASGQTANPITLAGIYADWPDIDDNTTVKKYLGHLVINATTTINAPSYAKTISDCAKRRSLTDTAKAVLVDVSMARAPGDIIEEAEQSLFSLTETQQQGREVSFKKALELAVDRANEAYKRGGGLAGLSTGYRDIDDKLGGLQGSDLIILAGRPAMGKTALSTNIAFNVAQKDKPVHFFSQEMSAEQLATRILSEQAEVASNKLRRGTFKESDMAVLMSTAETIEDYPLHIDETGGLTLNRLAQKARRIKRRYDTQLIIIDYIQLMTSGQKKDNRTQDITAITMGLKALAKELDIPIIALSQLSRNLEHRADKRPQLSDLRESGSIEQDADVVLFVYRDEYYLAREEPDGSDAAKHTEWLECLSKAKNNAELIIAKQRHGPTGKIELYFDAEHTRFGSKAALGQRGSY